MAKSKETKKGIGPVESRHLRPRKVIYTLKIVTALLEYGIEPIKVMKNPRRPDLSCWLYEVTDEFKEAFEEIMDSRLEGGTDHG